jgi:hypothetical protein
MAASISNFLYYVGGSIGTALFASLVTFGAGASGIPVEDISPEAFMDGFTFTMYWAVALSVVAVATTWMLNENRVRRA